MSDLIISGVEAGYGHVRVLHGVNLKVSDKPVALMGRNGMGKSTLAQVIMGLNATTAGTITYGGVTLTGLSPTKIANAGIGYVPQGRRVFPSLTVDEHLRILEKRNSQWSVKKVYDLFPRLGERKKNGGAMLSGGEQQMLAIGRALMTNPTLLLMDEPSEGLAPAIIEHLGNSLRDLVAQGQRVLLIEQNLKFASNLCDEIVILSNGEIQATISSNELRSSADLQNKYLGVA
jgi:branched-chain amino acid transport system ATP-binding protein